jgi:hypothetical protein
MSIGLCIQNNRFKKLQNKSTLLDSGHLFRYCTIITKQAQGKRTYETKPIPTNIVEAYHSFIKETLNEPYQYDKFGNIIPDVLEFDEEIHFHGHYGKLWNKLEASTAKGSKNDEDHMHGYIQKSKENLAKLSGLLHCILNICPSVHRVKLSTLELANQIIDLFIGNFKVAYDLMELGVDQENAKVLLEWMISRKEYNVCYTEQEIWQAKKSKTRFKNIEPIKKALAVLKTRNYIIEISNIDGGKKFRLNNNLL